jgi:hypothetical protein
MGCHFERSEKSLCACQNRLQVKVTGIPRYVQDDIN